MSGSSSAICLAKWLIRVCPIEPVTSGSAVYFSHERSRSSYILNSRTRAGMSVGRVTALQSGEVQ